MVSLWGNNKDNGDQNDDDEGMARGSQDSSRREATERDRLLPDNNRRSPRGDGYLDPDDPAVSIETCYSLMLQKY